jgi:hypothetical protein
MTTISKELVESFAPDSGTLSRGRSIARPGKYRKIGVSERAIWGVALGSSEYETCVDLQGPAFRCSCPVKKQPCKHVMGMLLLVAADPSVVVESHMPPDLLEWLQKRDAAIEKKKTAPSTTSTVKDVRAQEQRAEKRAANVDQGISELHRFLEDILNIGLAESSKRTDDVWQQVRRRLIDAQAAGLAEWLEQLRQGIGSGDDWVRKSCYRIVQLHLLTAAFSGRQQLPETWQEDIKRRIGWYRARHTYVRSVKGRWLILGVRRQTTSEYERQLVWMFYPPAGEFACLQHSVSVNSEVRLPGGFVSGRVAEGTLHYLSDGYSLRGDFERDNLMDSEPHQDWRVLQALATTDLLSAVTALQQQRVQQPFSDEWPLLVANMRLVHYQQRLALADPYGHIAILHPDFAEIHELLMAMGNQPATLLLTTENGRLFMPWGVLNNGEWTPVGVASVAGD